MTEASVVICAHTLDRWDELKRAVGSVLTQTHAPREIVVVVDNNEALRERATQEIAGVTVLANARQPGLSGGRMTGAEYTTAPVIAFLDDDAVADPHWLAELLEAYRDPTVLGAGGPVEPLWQVPP
ncbi:MAG: glycosyltransferase family 2 protein, partial [Mesorhizobium sp.]